MEAYQLIQNIIRLAPLLGLALLYSRLLKYLWYSRIGIMFFVGWFFVSGSTYVFWWYSFNYAPNETIMNHVAQNDGAPRLFAMLFGWAYGLVLVTAFEILRLLFLLAQAFKSRLIVKKL